MKNIFFGLVFIIASSNAFSQSISDVTLGITLSPFVTATKLLETTAVATLLSIESSKLVVQARGVAGKEQLKDELVALNEAILAGKVRSIVDVQQPGLRELFEEMMANEELMEEVYSIVEIGSDVHRIATVVTIILIVE